MICIPTVHDRIVQRAIVAYLTENKKLPIYNSSSYGFIKGRGPRAAIAQASVLRGRFEWCFKTDIETFFDRVPRPYLKTRLRRALRSHSLVPLIEKFADSEVKETPSLRPKLQNQGIRIGLGLRQGMPISPILTNLVLSDFDLAVENKGIAMVRYVDDILLFFHSKAAAQEGLEFVKCILNKTGFSIPELLDQSKTMIIAPQQPVDFLGREIVFLGSENKFVARVSQRQLLKFDRNWSQPIHIQQG